MIACVRISYGSLCVRESFLSYRSMEDKKELAGNADCVQVLVPRAESEIL